MIRLSRLRQNLLNRDLTYLPIASLLVGTSSALGIWLFKRGIDFFDALAFGRLRAFLSLPAPWNVLFIPILGGFLVGLLTWRFIGHEKTHGVAGVIEAVALHGGRLPYHKIVPKALASAISIGFGASVGPEDPSVQIGANIGCWWGEKWGRLSEETIPTLVAAGAASGVAAAFNAPIAGVFFAMEVILGEWSTQGITSILLASVFSSVVTQALSGAEPAFHVPAYAFQSAWELPAYLGLGVLAGLIAVAYVKLLYGFQDLFAGIRLWDGLKPALAGLGVGLIGMWLPQVFGVGYQSIEAVLNHQMRDLGLLLLLMSARLVLTPLSLGGGFKGGVFAPALFIGAMLGGAVGELLARSFSHLNIIPAAFAMVGMAAVLAAAIRAPFTAILLLFEMTRDYRIILPLMFSVGVSMWIAHRLESDSVYMKGLARAGIRIHRGRAIDVLENLTVSDVMAEPQALKHSQNLEQAWETLLHLRLHGLPVVDEEEKLIGMLTIQDIDRIPPEQWSTTRVSDVCTRQPILAYPDETLSVALQRMSTYDIGRLPVVSRQDPRQLIGILRRVDLVRAYNIALRRRALAHSILQEKDLEKMESGMKLQHYTIFPGLALIGRSLAEIPWPAHCLVVMLQRDGKILIPRGQIRLEAGDRLTVLCDSESEAEVQKLFQR
ncbi:MAG: chloride channel protein [Anaerolineales bacterium]